MAEVASSVAVGSAAGRIRGGGGGEGKGGDGGGGEGDGGGGEGGDGGGIGGDGGGGLHKAESPANSRLTPDGSGEEPL